MLKTVVSMATKEQLCESDTCIEPLINHSEASHDKKEEDLTATIPCSEAFCDIWKNSSWIMLSSFLNPIYSVVNAMVLGHQENEKLLAGLGLGSLTMGICAISIG